MKTAVVYWSGTGNTEAMAEAVQSGMQAAGADSSLIAAEDFGPDQVCDYQAMAFGCSSQGSEVLEESVFQPMWDDVIGKLGGIPIGLFGSYGWGDGEWMRNWSDEAEEAGLRMPADYVICNEAPDDEAISACEEMGRILAQS